MRTARRILHVAWNDLRIMVGDKVFFFWSLVFPMLFIVLFGLVFKTSGSAPAIAELTVVNLDEGRWGAYFLDKIKSPQVDLKIVPGEPAAYSRLIVLPPDFSAKIEARRAQTLRPRRPPASRRGSIRPSPGC
jgi:hypothetical protein